MHEFAIATNLLQIIEEQQRAYKFGKVEKIYLNIGEFSNVVPEALEFSFKIVAEGTVAAGAELVIKIVPLRLKCLTCKEEFHSEPYLFVCPKCGGGDLEILSGNELQIESIEVDRENGDKTGQQFTEGE